MEDAGWRKKPVLATSLFHLPFAIFRFPSSPPAQCFSTASANARLRLSDAYNVTGAMIKFPCKCGHIFNLTEDMAGGLIQCPRCGLLADVPTLSDLVNITEDGIFKIGDAAPLTDQITVADLHEAFSARTVDANGYEKDLRPDEEHYRIIGVPKEVDAVGFSPKYDPLTGELIQPLDIKETEPIAVAVVPLSEDETGDVPLAVIPIDTKAAGSPSIAYASNESRKQITPFSLLLELFMPGNLVVMLFIFAFYYLAEKAAGILEIGGAFFPPMPLLNIPLWLILAHYGAVIEEIGPNDCDELPRPFRHLTFQEDLVTPIVNVAFALLLSFLPAILAGMAEHRLRHLTRPIMLSLELIGAFFLPAVLLTTVTGISYANLRPDRLLSVIRICGGDYLLSVGVLLLGLFPSALFFAAGAILPPEVRSVIVPDINQPAVLLPLTAFSVYLTHFFCWHLGLLYRAHQPDFPWVMQHHVSARRDPVLAPPRRRRRTSV
jgi:hypothetical protein